MEVEVEQALLKVGEQFWRAWEEEQESRALFSEITNAHRCKEERGREGLQNQGRPWAEHSFFI